MQRRELLIGALAEVRGNQQAKFNRSFNSGEVLENVRHTNPLKPVTYGDRYLSSGDRGDAGEFFNRLHQPESYSKSQPRPGIIYLLARHPRGGAPVWRAEGFVVENLRSHGFTAKEPHTLCPQ